MYCMVLLDLNVRERHVVMDYPIKIIHELRHFMRLLLLNITIYDIIFYQNHAEKYYGF